MAGLPHGTTTFSFGHVHLGFYKQLFCVIQAVNLTRSIIDNSVVLFAKLLQVLFEITTLFLALLQVFLYFGLGFFFSTQQLIKFTSPLLQLSNLLLIRALTLIIIFLALAEHRLILLKASSLL